jgi:hypothetical protein
MMSSFLIALALSAAGSASECTLKAEDVFIREAPPSAQVLAGFGRLHNPARQSVSITRVSSPQFESVEVHEMSMDDGVMRMRPLINKEVAAEQSLVLESGGKHLMLYQPRAPLKAGHEVVLKVELDCGTTVEFKALVKKQIGAEHHHHH